MALLTGTGLRINRYCSMADFHFSKKFSFFKKSPFAILDFEKLKILTSGPVQRPNMRHLAKFREDRSNRSIDIADFRFFKMAAVRHLGLDLRVLGPPTKSTWWSLRLCKIW